LEINPVTPEVTELSVELKYVAEMYLEEKSPLASLATIVAEELALVALEVINGFPEIPSPFVTDNPVPDTVIEREVTVPAPVLMINPFVDKLCNANACPVNPIVQDLFADKSTAELPPVIPVPFAIVNVVLVGTIVPAVKTTFPVGKVRV
jgi:hypothetical protein